MIENAIKITCLASFLAMAACSPSAAPVTFDKPIIPADAFVTLKDPGPAHDVLCANDGMHPNFPDDADRITRMFCQDTKPGGVIPTVGGLTDLLKLLNLDFKQPNGANGVGGNPSFALLGHSSALTARKTSSITPRTFVFTPPTDTLATLPSDYIVLTFNLGEQFVEVASHDPTVDVVNFYLLFFDKACTNAPGGCSNVDLFTPAVTTGWSNVRIYESSTELNDTIGDCRQCHAPIDANPPFLRMQEIKGPFTHWFSNDTNGGRALLADFHAAHGTQEDFGPIPAALIDKSDPALLAKLITVAGFGDQPNAFDSAAIEAEVAAGAPGQPAQNLPIGSSQTWSAIYSAAVAGQFIMTPYHDVKVTDPTKLATLTNAYQQWMANPSLTLPDLTDVFLDAGLRDMGFAARLGLDGKGLLAQMCQQCHNANLDPTISRSNFLVDQLDQMSREEKDLAIARINLPIDNRLVMPPSILRTVTADERALMIMALEH